MSTWTHRITQHGIWSALESFGATLESAAQRQDLPQDALQVLDRLRAVLAFVGKRLEGADPLLLTTAPLDNLASYINAATSEAQAFVANGNTGHLNNASAQLDTALTFAWQLATPATSSEIGALRKASTEYRDTLERLGQELDSRLSALRAEIDAATQRLVALGNEITGERQRSVQLLTELQSQFAAAQEARTAAFADEARLRLVASNSAVEEIRAQFTSQLVEISASVSAAKGAHDLTLATQAGEFRDRSKALLDQIEAHKSQVEKLVEIIGNLGVTSGYQKAASEGRFNARMWQAIAVLAMVALIAIAYNKFLPDIAGVDAGAATATPFSWQAFAAKIFVSLTAGALAAYAASQADRYQSIERHNRRMALELEAIGPFISSLPEDQQREFRVEIGKRTFGRSHEETESRSKSPTSVVDLFAKPENRAALESIVSNMMRQLKP